MTGVAGAAVARPLRRWVIALLLCVIACVLCYLWVDRPVACLTSAHTRPLHLLTWTVELHRWADELALVAVAAGAFLAAARPRRIPRQLAVMVWLTALAILVTRAMKNQLQLVFGRTWPETYVDGNPSLIRDGVYRFLPLHGGPGYESFPSGTTATICAVFAVAWFWYPRLRLLYATVIGLVVFTLVTSNYHFVSDIIAGGFLGFSTGWFAIVVWESWGPQDSAPTPRGRERAVT